MSRTTIAKTVAYVVATIAAVSSYGHQVELLSLAHLDKLFGLVPSEWVGPLTVDSLAIIALMIRTSDQVTAATKRWAMVPLILAGGMSIAANVATATNLIQVVYGVWTVGAYVVAELFVAKMERKPSATVEVDDQTRARRSAAAKKGAATRAANKAKVTRKARVSRAKADDLEQVYALPSAPVSGA